MKASTTLIGNNAEQGGADGSPDAEQMHSGHLAESRQFRPKPSSDSGDIVNPENAYRPHWNEQLSELRLGNFIVREVRRTAKNIRKVLECFEEDGWLERIDSPFTDDEMGKETLDETVRTLNRR